MTRRVLVLIGVVLALALGVAWFVSRAKPAAEPLLDPVVPELADRAADSNVELASVPDLPVADASRAPARTSAKTSKTDWTARPHAPVYSLSGSVVDDRGVAVASFVIRAEPSGEDTEGRRYATDKFHDPSGAYRLPGVTDGEWSVFATDDLGLVSAARSIVLPRDARLPVDFVLPRSASISGRVLDLDGTLAKSAHVEAFRGVDEVEQSLRSVSTEEDGSFRLTGVLAVPLKLIARRNDRASSWIELAPRPGDALEGVVVTLLPGGTIEGRLYDSDQKPRAAVRVELSLVRASVRVRETSTMPDGLFRFEGVEPGPVTVSAPLSTGAPGMLSAHALAESGRITTVDLGVGPPTPIRVRGIVRAGGPIGSTVVSFAPGGAEFGANERMCRATTNQAGEYALRLAAAGRYMVEATTPDATTLKLAVAITDAPEQIVDLTLGTSVFAGRVVGSDGGPLRDVSVRAHARKSDEVGGARTLASTSTSADGTFRLEGLMPGSYALYAAPEVKSADGGLGPALIDGLLLAAGERREGLELRVGPSCRVRVLVLDSHGTPTRGTVVISGEVWIGFGFKVGADGVASTGYVPAGELSISARSFTEVAAAPMRITTVPGREVEATIRLAPAGVLVVRLARGDGSPILRPDPELVRVRGEFGDAHGSEFMLQRSPSSERYLRYGPLRPGTYTVRAQFGQRFVEALAVVTAGGEREVVLREPD